MENIELETVRGDDDGWTFEILEDDERKSDLTGSRFDMLSRRKARLSSYQPKQVRLL